MRDVANLTLAEALGTLMMEVGLYLGNGETDAEGENIDGGVLVAPTRVTTAAVLGPADAVSTIDDTGYTTIWVGDDVSPLRQLRAVLEQVANHMV